MLNAVPALGDLTFELARKGRANIAEAKLRCLTNLGTSLARRSSILYRNLDSEPIMHLVYYMGRTCLTVELSGEPHRPLFIFFTFLSAII